MAAASEVIALRARFAALALGGACQLLQFAVKFFDLPAQLVRRDLLQWSHDLSAMDTAYAMDRALARGKAAGWAGSGGLCVWVGVWGWKRGVSGDYFVGSDSQPSFQYGDFVSIWYCLSPRFLLTRVTSQITCSI